MRLARVAYAFGLLIAADPVAGADKCQGISDIAGQSAIAKPAIVATLKKKPEKGKLGELGAICGSSMGRTLIL